MSKQLANMKWRWNCRHFWCSCWSLSFNNSRDDLLTWISMTKQIKWLRIKIMKLYSCNTWNYRIIQFFLSSLTSVSAECFSMKSIHFLFFSFFPFFSFPLLSFILFLDIFPHQLENTMGARLIFVLKFTVDLKKVRDAWKSGISWKNLERLNGRLGQKFSVPVGLWRWIVCDISVMLNRSRI
jgi:hypothetical protein